MIALVHAEVRKITGTRLALGLLLGAVAITVVALGFTLWGPAGAGVEVEGAPGAVATTDDVLSLLGVVSIVHIFALILGVTFATAEYRHQTAATSFLAEPRRWRVLAAKAATVAVAAAGYAVVTLATATGVVWLHTVTQAIPLPLSSAVGTYMAMTVLAAAVNAVIGLGVGAAIRSQVGAVVAVLVWLFVLEGLIGGLLPSLAPWTPFAAGGAMTAPSDRMSAGSATVLAVSYAALAMVVGAWLTERRDVA